MHILQNFITAPIPVWLAGVICATLSTLLLQRSKDIKRITAVANTDALTGLLNRRALEDRLKKLKGSPVAVVFVDVDNFKSINDIFGYAHGDEVLRQVAKAICMSVRKEDQVYRFGGDEFVVVLSSASLHAAKNVAQRIEHCAALFQVSVSTGISYAWGDNVLALDMASQQMYMAKRAKQGPKVALN